MAKSAKPENIEVSFVHPTPQDPFYHVRVGFTLDSRASYQLKQVQVNGQRVRDFITYHNFEFITDDQIQGGGLSEIVVRYDWKAGQETVVEISAEGAEGTLSLKPRAQAPALQPRVVAAAATQPHSP